MKKLLLTPFLLASLFSFGGELKATEDDGTWTDSLETIWKQWSPWRELLEFTIEPCADLDQTVALYC